MNTPQKQEPKDYKKSFTNKHTTLSDNDNDSSHVKNKCYTLSADHSATSIGFTTPEESNNCPYMLRKRFKYIQGWIILKFSEETLFVYGKNLDKLYTDICRHKVSDIFIADYDEEDTDDPYVESITLKPNSEVDIDELPTKPKR
jgi:hypothetical protein